MMMQRTRTGWVAAILVIAALGGAPPAAAKTLFTLTGHGWGHGIGLSQWGAYGYAKHGWSYQRMLRHYYRGTRLEHVRPGRKERVLLAERSSVHIHLDAGATARTGEGHSRRLRAGSYRIDGGSSPRRLRVWSHSRWAYIWKRIPESIRITPHGRPIRLNDSANGFRRAHWWGSFRIFRSGGTLTLVDAVGLDRYAASVAACEVPSDWPSQALRAQAVVSRSYALATKNPGGLFDAYPDTRSQSACPVEHVSERIARAADATRRRVVTYHGHVATTFYSSSSGGRTSSISASWGGTDLPYLVPVRDRYDRAGGHNPNHTWEAVGYRPRRLAAQLDLSHRVTRVDPTIDRASRRVLRLTVHTRGGGSTRLSAGTVFADLLAFAPPTSACSA